MYAYPVVSPGHHEAFVFTLFAMGKYLKQISRLVGTHQCKNTSKGCGLCWEGVAQRWRNYLFTLATSENKKKKGIIFSPKWKANKQVFLSRQRGQAQAACGSAAACRTQYEKEGDTLRFFPTTSSPSSSLSSSLSMSFCDGEKQTQLKRHRS